MEKLVTPYKAITAHVWCVPMSADEFSLISNQSLPWLDERLSSDLVSGFASADFSHLPVLGVPGWWPDQDASFYGDTSVFRPRKQR